MLEIHQPLGAVQTIEGYLRAHGFFQDVGGHAAGIRADVFLGFGLSAASLRSGAVPPPEPAALPLAACRIRDTGSASPRPGLFDIGEWQRTWTSADYERSVALAREAIAAGEIYQVNLVQHLSAPFDGEPAAVAAALAQHRPLLSEPFTGVDWAIVSASPELFLARRGDRLWTTPIKGTRPHGEAAALRASVKDAAEHVMIVDLERNDLGRVCEPGSIRVSELMEGRSMAGVEHLVSTVEGRLRSGTSWSRIMTALFPGGSVTGAPKIAALDYISRLEPVGRGASMGALGTVWPNGDFELALTIRTFAIAAGCIHLWVGGGVVWDSDAAAEVEESWVKARPLLQALGSNVGTSISA